MRIGGIYWGKVHDAPSLAERNTDYVYDLDREIQKLRDTLPKANAANRKWCMHYESTASSFTELSGSILVGKGVKVEARRQKDTKKINRFNARINFKNETIEDFIRYSWRDNIQEANSFWRTWRTSEIESGIDLSRIDPVTMNHVWHPEKGYSIFIQRARTWNNKTKFFDDSSYKKFVKTYNPNLVVPHDEEIVVVIPDNVERLVRVNLFEEPPMDPIVPLIVYKKWIIWYMRKHSQKYWSPFTVAKLGSDKYIPTIGEYAKYKNNMDQQIPNMYNFSGISIPGWIDLKQLQSASASDGQLYVNSLSFLNSEIMNGLFGSMQQREASGKSGRSAAEETSRMWVGFMEAKRAQLERVLRNFYAKVLIGDEDPENIDVEWSPLRAASILDIMAAVERASSIGTFDNTETRRMAQLAFDFIEPKKEFSPANTLAERKLKKPKTISEPQPGENKPPLAQKKNGQPGGQPTTVRKNP